jgi:SpoIVB peptidase S55
MALERHSLMVPRRVVSALGICLLLVLPLAAQESNPFFPLGKVQPGLKGVGRTVFEGNQVQEFQVEFLGVLKNAIAPKHDVILARLSGGPLDKTGVVAGMSGSPVYVDGKLVGAVALAFPFAKEAFAGITPIEEMLDVVPAAGAAEKAAPASVLPLRILPDPQSPSAVGRLIPDARLEEGDWNELFAPSHESGPLSSLRLPLRFGGFSSQAVNDFTPLFRQMGFEPMEGGILSGSPASSSESAKPLPEDLVPGKMISVLLVEGDLNLNVDCTITYRQADKLYACGHRFLMTGPVEFPFAPSRVLATVASLASSFKVDEPGAPVGSIRQDRFGAIYGVVGEHAKMIPVRIQVDSTLNRRENYQFDIVEQDFLSPLLLNLSVVSTLGATERIVGPSTLNLKGSIRLSNGDAVNLEDVLSSDQSTAGMAGAAVSTPLMYLLRSGFPNLRVTGIDLEITVRNEKQSATLEQAWSTKSEVRPGDHIEVTAVLRTPSGESVVEKIPVDIPDSVRDKTLSLMVGSGPTINAIEGRFSPLATTPRDLYQLVRALNRMRRNNRLYALLMAPQRSFVLQGDEYPSPPPSLVQTFLADPAVSSSVIYRGTSVVGDFETKPSAYSIEGQKTLLLKVTDVGP